MWNEDERKDGGGEKTNLSSWDDGQSHSQEQTDNEVQIGDEKDEKALSGEEMQKSGSGLW